MLPLVLVLVPGVLGGVVLALVLAHISVRPPIGSRRERLLPTSPSFINMAHIPVSGVGGLGMVAMAAAVAIAIPWIRMSVALALALGIGTGILLILSRRSGPLESSSRHRGAHSDAWSGIL